MYLSNTSPAPEKPGKYLKTPFRRRRSIFTHFSGAGEVFIYTSLAPEKYLYTPAIRGQILRHTFWSSWLLAVFANWCEWSRPVTMMAYTPSISLMHQLYWSCSWYDAWHLCFIIRLLATRLTTAAAKNESQSCERFEHNKCLNKGLTELSVQNVKLFSMKRKICFEVQLDKYLLQWRSYATLRPGASYEIGAPSPSLFFRISKFSFEILEFKF